MTTDTQQQLGLPLYRTKAEIVEATEAVMAKRREVAQLDEAVQEAQEAVERTKSWARLAKAKGDHKAAVRQLRQLERFLPEGIYRAEHPAEEVPGADPVPDEVDEFTDETDPRD